MNMSKILVTGSTGKTGTPVVQQLLDYRFPVRALVRQLDERSESLQVLGAEILVGDFLDLYSVRKAMRGISRVYFCYPPSDGLLQVTAHIALAARDEGVEAIVNMSQISARENARSPLAHQHWLSEQIFDWAGVGASHIRPTFFAEDLYLFTGGSIAREGKIYLPFGDEKHAPIAAVDIARVVVGILSDPAPHIGEHYVLTGPRNMDIRTIAGILGKILGNPVEYINIPIGVWRTAMVEKFQFPEFLATHLASVVQDHQDGIFNAETDVVRKIGGQEPQTLDDFVALHEAMF